MIWFLFPFRFPFYLTLPATLSRYNKFYTSLSVSSSFNRRRKSEGHPLLSRARSLLLPTYIHSYAVSFLRNHLVPNKQMHIVNVACKFLCVLRTHWLHPIYWSLNQHCWLSMALQKPIDRSITLLLTAKNSTSFCLSWSTALHGSIILCVCLFVCLRMQICNRICQLNVILLWSTSDGWRDKLKNWGWCLRLPRVTNSEIHLFSFHSTLISVNIVRHLNKFEICLCFATFIIAGTAAERAYQWQHF